MTIKQIKAELSILTVLSHYGLKPNANKMLNCPFHSDKKASMKIYPDTNTVYCFAGSCEVDNLDAIDFIMQMDGSNKHKALLKASQLAVGSPQLAVKKTNSIKMTEKPENFATYRATLKRHTAAKTYCEKRCLDWRSLQIGYKSRRTIYKWGRGCLVFPLKNKEGLTATLYGRSIEGNNHYYQSNRQGLYPNYPDATTKSIILTESVIDAASLLQQEAIIKEHSILALYGTNGLTEEHIEALQSLSNLEQIIFFFDGDAAGKKAVLDYAEKLKKLLPKVRLMNIDTLENEDINSILQAHEPTILTEMVANRKPLKAAVLASAPVPSTAEPATRNSQLDTTNPNYITFSYQSIKYTLMGGINLTEMDRMRATLRIHPEPLLNPSYSIRHSLDLYNDDQLQKLSRKASERLEVGSSLLLTGLCELVNLLEDYRMTAQQKRIEPSINKRLLTAERATKAKAWLKKPDLLKRTNIAIGQTGIVGEEKNRLLVYLCFTSRLTNNPLHVITLGPSGSGKTYLQEKIAELLPEQEVLQFTTSTENAMYYFEQGDLRHKLVLCEDLDGVEGVLYTLRELMSKDMISKIVTKKDSKGNMKTERIIVQGPIVLAATTTRDRVYEDNANRSLLISPDFSSEQAGRIQDYQRKLSAGSINKTLENKWKSFFKDVQSVLKSVAVRNPYAEQLRIPKSCFKPLRTNAHYLHFIEALTFYHQYQRPIKKCKISGEPYIETTIEDLKAANNLIQNILIAKTDELSHQCRHFFERLKKHLEHEHQNSFYSQQIRAAFRLNPNTLKYYLRELIRYGQLKIVGGNRYSRGYEYEVQKVDGLDVLRQNVQRILDQTLEQITESRTEIKVQLTDNQ